MFYDLSYRQNKGALEDLEKDGETTFQRTRQRQGALEGLEKDKETIFQRIRQRK